VNGDNTLEEIKIALLQNVFMEARAFLDERSRSAVPSSPALLAFSPSNPTFVAIALSIAASPSFCRSYPDIAQVSVKITPIASFFSSFHFSTFSFRILFWRSF
jgi:hypothetical protein